MEKDCSGDHRHIVLIGGGRARRAQVYPDELCREIIIGLRNQTVLDGRIGQNMIGAVDKIDEVNFSMDIESDGGDTNNNKADNINDNNGLTKIVSKNAIPVDNHPTYFTEHFQKIFNEFAYCNVQYIALSFNDGPLGITLEAIDGRPDLYRVAQLNPDGQAAKKIVLQVGDILRTVNNIEVQGKDFDDVVKIIQKVKRPAI